MKLIVGLGNPDKKYDNTRHNVGFMVVDAYLNNINYTEKFNGLYYKTTINNEVVCFVKPLTYMNLSGNCVQKYVDYFDVDINDILIIQDDLDEDFGKYKLKKASGSGGHNGINSIISCLKTNEFARLKIGIRNDRINEVVDFVLGKFSKEERKILDENMSIFKNIIDEFICSGIEKTMNMYNKK